MLYNNHPKIIEPDFLFTGLRPAANWLCQTEIVGCRLQSEGWSQVFSTLLAQLAWLLHSYELHGSSPHFGWYHFHTLVESQSPNQI